MRRLIDWCVPAAAFDKLCASTGGSSVYDAILAEYEALQRFDAERQNQARDVYRKRMA